MNPALKYPGAKRRLAPWIIGQMPSHEGYLEPFFGSGGVFFNKPPSRVETLNDLDGSVVHFFKVCREQPEELARALSLTPWSREEFLQSDFRDGQTSDIEAARQFAVRCWMTFGARTRCKTGWRHTTGAKLDGGPDNPKLWARLPDTVQQVAARLQHAQFENRPALDLIQIYDGPEVLIYADPPYIKETRTLNGDQYRYEMTDDDHEKLLMVLNRSSSMVLLSGYDCDLYRDMLPGWKVTMTKSRAERGAKRIECLWANPAAAERQNNQGVGKP